MDTPAKPAVAFLLVAAGKGLRAGGADAGTRPKQYRLVAGKSSVTRCLDLALAHMAIGHIQPVIAPGDGPLFAEAVAPHGKDARILPAVPGGSTRQESVRNGLEALRKTGFSGIVLVHDAARPFLTAALIDRAIEAAVAHKAAVPGLAVTDTVKQVDAQGRIVATPAREALRRVQTPQAFDFAALLDAHRDAETAGLTEFTDDAAVMEWAGHGVHVFAGEAANIKLTTPEDFAMAEASLAPALRVVVAQGYDVHRFGPGDHVWLGGVRIAHGQGVEAHSDGDVILHALTDALLGALGDGDIGVHFPPSDPRWRGAASDQFLRFAAARVMARGGIIDHLDITLVCEAPRVGPHRAAIVARIAEIAGVQAHQVGLKATTSERMGFTGRGEGLAALAVATIRLPEAPHG